MASLPHLDLHNGQRIPAFGLGLFVGDPSTGHPGNQQERKSVSYKVVRWALDLGYRMVDTAARYGNEEIIGQAIRDSGIPRKDVFVTTKIWRKGYDSALKQASTSIGKLGLGYVDLLLIHMPEGGELLETWDAMIELQKRGLVRSLGVANFNVHHIEVFRTAGRPMPVINQIQMHPMVYNELRELVEFCRAQSIVVQAYSSIFCGDEEALKHPLLAGIVAGHRSKTPAQILLRWALQNGFAVIPKTVQKHRLLENMDIFDFNLTESEVEQLNAMGGGKLKIYGGGSWNPLDTPVEPAKL